MTGELLEYAAYMAISFVANEIRAMRRDLGLAFHYGGLKWSNVVSLSQER